MDEIRPGYYAIIPADVRYDDRIPANAKLLYGELSALIGKDGFCFASNAYFMNLYKFSDPTVTRLLRQLEEHGYITREQERDSSGKVVRRKIFLNVSAPEEQPPIKNDTPNNQNQLEGGIKNDGYTNTSITEKKNKRKESVGKSEPLTDEELRPLVVAAIQEIAEPEWTAATKNELFHWVMALYDPNRKVKKAHPIRSKLSVDGTFRKLTLSGKDPDVMIGMLCSAIEGGWQGVQVPKSGTAAKPKREEVEYRCL